MSRGYYMNMEKLSLKIIDSHIKLMTNDNLYDDVFINDDILLNNIENGFVVIVQLNAYIESYLNTILNACMNYSGDKLLKCSIDEKLDIIFMHYRKELSIIKSDNSWNIYNQVTKVRNEMIHYKKTYIGEAAGLPDFKLGGQFVSEFFTKSYLEQAVIQFIKLAKNIADTIGLKIYEDMRIFSCAGRDGLVNYVYDETLTNIDEDRFKN